MVRRTAEVSREHGDGHSRWRGGRLRLIFYDLPHAV
jgi:hypothetical protein